MPNLETIKDLITQDQEMTALYSKFLRSKYIIPIKLASARSYIPTVAKELAMNDKFQVVEFIYNLLTYQNSSISDDNIVMSIKYFYLMANVAAELKETLLDTNRLTHKGHFVYFDNDITTKFYIRLDYAIKVIGFVYCLKSDVSNKFYLDISRDFSLGINDYTFRVTLGVGNYTGQSTVNIIKLDDITKDLLNDMLNKI